MSKARDIADLGSNDVLETSSTGLDVTGTVTADGLTVGGTTSLTGLTKITGVRGTFVDPSEDPSVPNIFATNDAVGDFSQEAGHLVIQPRVHPTVYRDVIFAGGAGTTKRLMNIKGEGDVEFFEDTGTTAKMVWDASAESLILKGNDLDLNNGTALHRITNDNTNLLIRADYGNTNANSTIQFSVDGTEAMRIDSSGNVGIGTDSPQEELHIEANYPQLRIASDLNIIGSNNLTCTIDGHATDGRAWRIGRAFGSSDMQITNDRSSSMTFSTNGSERARIDSSGNLLVGTSTSPVGSGGLSVSNRFTVGYQGALNGYGAENYSGIFYSGGNNSGYTAINSNSGNGCLYLSRTASAPTGLMLHFASNGSAVGSITSNGSTTSYNTSSDERLKENIQDTTHTVDINDIQVREFDWKVDGSHQRYGFIAQELETVYPEAVHSPEDADEMKSVDYSKLVPLLVKEIQQLKAEIKELKA